MALADLASRMIIFVVGGFLQLCNMNNVLVIRYQIAKKKKKKKKKKMKFPKIWKLGISQMDFWRISSLYNIILGLPGIQTCTPLDICSARN